MKPNQTKVFEIKNKFRLTLKTESVIGLNLKHIEA